MKYDREKAVAYAVKWAKGRNPKYYNFDNIGGDCTNFISQCLYVGSGIMNYTPVTGWYYISLDKRSAAWSSVEYLHKFLTTNKGPSIYGKEMPIDYAELGDVIQISFDGIKYVHTTIITSISNPPLVNNISVSTHSDDFVNRPLNTYPYQKIRMIHIEGVRS